jgi:hypothetical protein
MRPFWWLPIGTGLLLAGCATLPTGPDVLVLPGSGKDFDEFQVDDAVCRQWASQQIGTTKKPAASQATVTGAASGTTFGATGATAVGAAAGSPATGAAIGSGVGEPAAGAESGASAEWRLQRRYDMAYMQCMYAKGNQIPIRQSPPPTSAQQGSTEPPPPLDVPPPPPGNPPPPPTDY